MGIEDPDDERLALFRGLNDPNRRRLIEARSNILVAEGAMVLAQLVASDHPVLSVLTGPARVGEVAALVAGTGAPVWVVDDDVLAGVVGYRFHRGVLALGARLPPASPATVVGRALAGGAPTLLVVEGVNDHQNLGSLYRNAAALGAGAVLLDPTCADPLYRRAVRVSMGQSLRVPTARMAPWPSSLTLLRDAGCRVVALTPDPRAADLARVSVDHRPVAVLVGAEGPGLGAPSRAAADLEVRIPVAPGVDSLNVATAAAIALHHWGMAGPGDRRSP